MNEQKKIEIRNHLIQILIGIVIIIPFFNEKSWLRFIALGGFLLIMYNVIWFVRNSEEILFHIFPSKTFREKKPKLKDKIWSHISMTLFFSGLIFLIFQMGNIENTIEESSFWKTFGLLGFGFSMLSLLVLYIFQPSVFSESGRRYSVVFGFLLGFTSLIISTFSFFNKEYAETEITKSIYTIDRKSTGGKNNNTHWIFIKINDSKKRFEIKPKLWNKLNTGDEIFIKTQSGYFEYDFVTEIKPTANTAYKK
jgi:hypothetical protein